MKWIIYISTFLSYYWCFAQADSLKTKADSVTQAFRVYNDAIDRYEDYQFDTSIVLFSKAIELHPEFADAYNNRGIVKKRNGDFFGALKDYDKAISLDSSLTGIVLNNKASCERVMGDFLLAEEFYKTATDTDSTLFKAYNNAGVMKVNIQDYSGAMIDLNNAIDANPLYEFAYNNRGYLYFKLKQYGDALADFDKAIDLNLYYGEAYENRGIVKEKIGDLEGACLDWEKAAELGMDFSYIYLSNDCEDKISE